MSSNNFNEVIQIAMDRLGLKKSDIAKATGYTNQHIGDLLSGGRRWNEDTIEKVCAALGIEVTYEIKEDVNDESTSLIE